MAMKMTGRSPKRTYPRRRKGAISQLRNDHRWQHPGLPRRRPGKRDTRAPYQRIHDESISEAALQQSLLHVAAISGWMVHHETDSRRSHAGFPDLTCAHPDHGHCFIELKSERGSLEPDQFTWRDYLVASGARYYLFRPRDRFVADRLFRFGEWPAMEEYLV